MNKNIKQIKKIMRREKKYEKSTQNKSKNPFFSLILMYIL